MSVRRYGGRGLRIALLLAPLITGAALPSTTACAADAQLFAASKSADELMRTLLAVPARELAQTRVLRGKFIHRKYLGDIPAPLESSGEFMFLRDRGLYWHTQTPFDSVFVLTPQGMSQTDEGGRALKLSSDQQPALRVAARIFMALFAVDLKALDGEFNLFGIGTAGGWQLGLRPKNAALAQVFTEGIVSGGAHVRQVELRDAHGDRTVIELLDTQLLARAPTDQERGLLAQ